MEQLMCRPCVWICNKPATERSSLYGVTICSDACLQLYRYQKTKSTSLTTLFPMHGALMRQAFIESVVNKTDGGGNLDAILEELSDVDQRIATIVYTGIGKDIASLLQQHIYLIISEPRIYDKWLDNGMAIVAMISPAIDDEEYTEMLTHMSKYQYTVMEEIEKIKRHVKHDDLYLKTDSHLVKLAESIDKVILGYPREAKPDTPVRMVHPQSGRTVKK